MCAPFEDVILLADLYNCCVKYHVISTGQTKRIWKDVEGLWYPTNVCAFRDDAGEAIAVMENKTLPHHHVVILRPPREQDPAPAPAPATDGFWVNQQILPLSQLSLVCNRYTNTD